MSIWTISSAYIATGFLYVARDFREPAYNRPAYIRNRQISLVVLLILLWLPWTIRVLYGYWHHDGWHGIKKYFVKDLFWLYSVFAGLSYVFAYVFR